MSTIKWQNSANGYILRGASYVVRVRGDYNYRLEIEFDGASIATLPGLSTLNQLDRIEKLDHVKLVQMIAENNRAQIILTADSSCWNKRTFYWSFTPTNISFYHTAEGQGRLGQCFFFSRNNLVDGAISIENDIHYNCRINLTNYFTPWVRLSSLSDFDVINPGSAGLTEWNQNLLFAPCPLMFAFYKQNTYVGIGLGCKPGSYNFRALEYSGSKIGGASFYVDYLGYQEINGFISTPAVAMHFGYDRYDVLKQHIAWTDLEGYSTKRKYENADWHREPVFCSWAEQGVAAAEQGVYTNSACTQQNFENWINILEERQIPASTLIIDEKWQKQYGTFEIDVEKWPDMKGFVAKQHDKGRHVLLWAPGYHTEGLPAEWCSKDPSGKIKFANPFNRGYEAFLREKLTYLVKEVGVDGFKEDWFGGTAAVPGYTDYGPHGIELLRKFQTILFESAHQVKPDAMIQTQTPNPLFRDCSDVLRLNDIYCSTRMVSRMMQNRARIAKIAGWEVIDCDNASSTTADEWFDYMQKQILLGTPSLYCLTRTEFSKEEIPDYMWAHISAIWKKYREDNDVQYHR